MKAVVTGATSFIGAVTVRQLLERGDQVYAVVRPDSRNLRHLLEMVSEESMAYKTARPQLRIIPLELGDIGQIRAHVDGADAWVHIGWEGAGSDNRRRRDVQQRNVRYGLAAVEAAASIGCWRFLFTGSQAEYGPCRERITEDTPCNPVSEYGIAKLDFANQAKTLCKKEKIEYIHTRIFSVYGPGDHPWSLVQTCLRAWRQGSEMKLGACTQQWNFLYIEDAVSALVHLLTEAAPGVYNVAGSDTRPLRDYIEELYRLCGSRGSFVYGERPENAEGPADLMPDISKLLRATSWRPKTSFAEGIHEMLYCMQEAASCEAPVRP